MIASLEKREIFTVVSDVHGQSAPFQKAIELAQSHDATLVVAGDLLHGGEDLQVLQMVRSLGDKAIYLAGNHEWSLLGYLYDEREENRDAYRDGHQQNYYQFLKKRKGQGIFGLGNKPDREDILQILQKNDVEGVLKNTHPYLQVGNVFISHATTSGNIEEAKQHLRQSFINAAYGYFDDPIDEIARRKVAEDLPGTSDDIVYVHGHFHNIQRLQDSRDVSDVKRINLARMPDNKLDVLIIEPGKPLYIQTVCG